MNLDILFAVIFYSLVFMYYLTHKEKFEVQGKIFVLYKTKIGLKLMDRIARFSPKILHSLSYLSILLGFVGMVGIFYILVKGTITLLTVESATPVIAPVLPGVAIPGLPILSFWHWIIAILVVAVIHEFSHGIFSRLYNIPIKSSGFAFLGPILAAFVEPDEKELEKKSKFKQLAVFSAGPFSNVLTGFIVLLISAFLISPFAVSLVDYQGIKITSVSSGSPAELAGLEPGEEITEINSQSIQDLTDFINATSTLTPGQEITLTTINNTYSLTTIENPSDETKAYMGVSISSVSSELKQEVVEKYGSSLPSFFLWFTTLVEWIFLISFGIGLANLLPLGPVDGGRMLFTALLGITKNEEKSRKIWSTISLFTLALIIINLWPYIQQLLVFIFSPLLALL